MSSHVHSLREPEELEERPEPRAPLTRLLGMIDLLCAFVMVMYPALATEIIYPHLTPHGVLLAVIIIGWGRLGRGLCALLTPRASAPEITSWLWIAALPAHCAALVHFGWDSLTTAVWHMTHITLTALVSRHVSILSR